ncbi:MAG: heme-dependent oxidative N-demethylase subunit alpha family protein [Burkholderiaceae bacterium]
MPFDFSAVSAPFRMQPGLRKLTPGAQQLTPNQPGDRALAEKLLVLQHDADRALLCAPGFDAMPALHALMRHAVAEHPHAFAFDGEGHFAARRLGWSLRADEAVGNGPPEIGACLHALPAQQRLSALLALAFAEDFAVIDAGSGRVDWLAVCLPSRWAPEEKVGRHFTEVHAPVADNQLLLAASEHIVRLVTGPERWERFVWTLVATGQLDQHPLRHVRAAWPLQVSSAELAAATFLRTERQTFIPVPDLQQAVFTIHVETTPLADVVRAPGASRKLHDALASMSAAVLAYRGLGDAQAPLLSWLSEQAAAP